MFRTLASTLFLTVTLVYCHKPFIVLGLVAGTTGLEPATSAVTVSHPTVTHWNQEARMAALSTLRNPWEPLLHP